MSDVTLFDEIATYIGDENANLVVNLLSMFAEIKVIRTHHYYIILSRSKTSRELLDVLKKSSLQNIDDKFVYLADGFCVVVGVTPIDIEMVVVIKTNGEVDVQT